MSLSSKTAFLPNNSGCYLHIAQPLIQCFTLLQHQQPLKASKQLLVSCNGLPVPDVVFTLRPLRQFALWPQLTQLIHQPCFQSMEPQRLRHFSSLLYFATSMANSPAVFQKQCSKKHCFPILYSESLQTLCSNRISYYSRCFRDAAGRIQTQVAGDETKKHPPVFLAGVRSTRMAVLLSANCANTSPTTSSPPTTLSCFNFLSIHESRIWLLPLMLTVDYKEQIAEQLKHLHCLLVYCKQGLLLPMWVPKDYFQIRLQERWQSRACCRVVFVCLNLISHIFLFVEIERQMCVLMYYCGCLVSSWSRASWRMMSSSSTPMWPCTASPPKKAMTWRSGEFVHTCVYLLLL